MGNTADLAMVQKTINDTLHKESKSGGGGGGGKLENTVKQSRFKHLGELHKE